MTHFFEKIQRDIDFTKEYIKIEKLVCTGLFFSDNNFDHYVTVNEWIEENFHKWEKRETYTSFAEVREQCGFSVEIKNDRLFHRSKVSMEEYFLYSEMICNIIYDLVIVSRSGMSQELRKRAEFIIETIKAVVEKCGYELLDDCGEKNVVSKNQAAVVVADKVPELSDVIIEYNHFLLKGNLERKQEILMKITRSLEAKIDKLNQIDGKKTKDFFHLANEMNIRHNNVDSDSKSYRPVFAKMSLNEKEKYYDLLYEQALLLYMLLDQPRRNKLIKEYNEMINSTYNEGE